MAGGEQLFSRPGIWLGFLIVLPIAVISGLKPGGGVPVFVILLGLTSHLDPWVVVCVAIFYKAASDLMEPVPSILLGIPGGRSAQATVLDGYPMAQKGLAGVAIGASYTCNLIGGVFGALVLLALLPFARQLILIFGSAEFFLLTMIGVMTVAVVSSGAFIKGLLTGGLGIAIAMVGYSAIGGDIRATFGLNYLYDGVPLGPLVVGLFAIPEAVALVVGGKPVAGKRVDLLMKEADRRRVARHRRRLQAFPLDDPILSHRHRDRHDAGPRGARRALDLLCRRAQHRERRAPDIRQGRRTRRDRL